MIGRTEIKLDRNDDSSDPRAVAIRRLRDAASIGADEDLADAIVAVAERFRPDGLELFLDAVPDLADRPVSLDAAIEAALASRHALGQPGDQAASELASRHPSLAEAIRVAALLGGAMDGTRTIAARLRTPRVIELPMNIGPVLGGGVTRYQLCELLGVGSQGAVYLAKDRLLSDESHPAWVAAKIGEDSEIAGTQHDAASEALRARRVIHPNVVRVFDRFHEPELGSVLILEHVRAGTLESWLSGQPSKLQAKLAATIASQIARGMQAAHSAGVVHRDLKPSNILMADGAMPKITDFGVAAVAADSPVTDRIGSMGFCSPEQYALAPDAATPRADVYSLGGVLLWLLTGEPPNGADAESSAQNLCGPSLLRKRHEAVLASVGNPDLVAVCLRALDYEPSSRYASADSFASDLDLIIAGYPLSWRPAPFQRRLAMHWKRSPLAVSSVIVAAMLGATGTAIGAYAIILAIQARNESALAAAEDRVEQGYRRAREADLVIERVTRFVAGNGQGRIDANWLNINTFIEAFLGKQMLQRTPNGALLWDERINVARKHVEAATAAGRADHIEPMMYEACLGVWLLDAQRYSEAQVVLERSRTRWARVCAPGDELILQFDGLILVARGGQLISTDPALAKQYLSQARQKYSQISGGPSVLDVAMSLLEIRIESPDQ